MFRRVLSSCLIALALLAACGSNSDDMAARSPTSAATSSATAPTSAPATFAPTVVPNTQPTQNSSSPTTGIAANDGPLPQIALRPVTTELDRPVFVTHASDGSGRLFVVEKRGTIALLRDGQPAPTPFLDITDRVGSSGSEQGLLSVAFHPRYVENGRLFVNYTDRNGDTVISRFQASGDTADPNSEFVLLNIPQPYANHNGGLVAFGPDGYLYIGMGDGGSGGDPHGNGQNPETLLGKMLRIDVDGGDPYGIPADNPWADSTDARAEVWATGLRNPWRFSFDRATGDLYIADVGQGEREEVSLQRAGGKGGANYGWNLMEGSECYRGNNCDPSQFVAPIAEYTHEFGCSITGGYVYRGATQPGLNGIYVFGDYCSGLIWLLRETSPGQWEQSEPIQTSLNISSFGEDESGELYVTSLSDNGVYQIIQQ